MVGVASPAIYNAKIYKFRGGNPTTQGNNYGSYAINNAYWGQPSDYLVHAATGRKLSAIPTPSEALLVMDGNGSYYFGPTNETAVMTLRTDLTPVILKGTSSGEDGYGQSVVQRHLDTTPTLFADGHVKVQRIEDIGKVECVKFRTNAGTTYANIQTALTMEDDQLTTGCP